MNPVCVLCGSVALPLQQQFHQWIPQPIPVGRARQSSYQKKAEEKKKCYPLDFGQISWESPPFCLFFRQSTTWQRCLRRRMRVSKKQISISCLTANLFLDVGGFIPHRRRKLRPLFLMVDKLYFVFPQMNKYFVCVCFFVQLKMCSSVFDCTNVAIFIILFHHNSTRYFCCCDY